MDTNVQISTQSPIFLSDEALDVIIDILLSIGQSEGENNEPATDSSEAA